MKITGELKPISGYEYNYKVALDTTLTEARAFGLATSPTVAYFKLPNGTWSTFRDVSCVANDSYFTITLMWTKEQTNVVLIVTDKTGKWAPARLEVNISCEKCTLTMDSSEIKLGDKVICKGLLSRKFESKFDVKSEWNIDNNIMNKDGNPIITDGAVISQPFKALKIGKGEISAIVSIFDYNKKIAFEFNRGKLKVEVKSPYSVTIDYGENFASQNSILSYHLNGMINNSNIQESIRWWCNGFGILTSEQGKASATFRLTSPKGLFEVAAIVTVNDQELRVEANKKIWIGPPSITSGIIKEHSMDAGTELTLWLTEFTHYTGNIEYTIESGLQNKIIIERLAVNRFRIKSKHPKISSDIIKIKFIASNICGIASNTHTIQIKGAPGVSFDKPIELSFAKEHYIIVSHIYNWEEYGGDLQDFELYFRFSLERKATFNRISALVGLDNLQAFKLYDENKNIQYTYLPPAEADFRIEEMKAGKYYWVIDAKRENKEENLTITVDGIVNGSNPTSPYIVDINDNEFNFNDCRDTTNYNHNFSYINDEGLEVSSLGAGNHIYYIIKLVKPMQLTIHTAGSAVCTEIHIMQGEPYNWTVFHHDTGIDSFEEVDEDNEASQDVKDTIFLGQTYIKKNLLPGEYRIVFNGIKKTNGGTHNGLIYVHILGKKVRGMSFENAYDLGTNADGIIFYLLNQIWKDMIYYKENNNNSVYFHFNIQKMMSLKIAPRIGNIYLPVDLYNCQKKKTASSTLGNMLMFTDALKDDYYFSVLLNDIESDTFMLEISSTFHGTEPLDSYNLGSYQNNFSLTDKANTSYFSHFETFYYKGDNGQWYVAWGSNINVFYDIELKCEMKLLIHTTHSKVCTELHIMEGEPYDWKVLLHDIGIDSFDGVVDNLEFPQDLRDNIYLGQTCIKVQLPAGKYKLVFNGIKKTNGGVKDGLIVVNIEGTVI